MVCSIFSYASPEPVQLTSSTAPPHPLPKQDITVEMQKALSSNFLFKALDKGQVKIRA